VRHVYGDFTILDDTICIFVFLGSLPLTQIFMTFAGCFADSISFATFSTDFYSSGLTVTYSSISTLHDS